MLILNEEMKVTLTADIKNLKHSFKEATVISENFNKQIEKTRYVAKDAFGNYNLYSRVGGEIAKQNKLYAEQQKILTNISKLQTNKAALTGLGTITTAEGNNYSGQVANFKKETQQAIQNLDNLKTRVDDTGGRIDKAFTKGLKSVKRLTLGFLGARTAFSLFRKYMSNYQSQNEEFANKMQLTTNIITNALAPAFEFFGNVIQYAVIGLARIIELLTGVNILGKTVDNSLKGAGKSAKELNDNLSGLDEISNIQEDSGGLSTAIGSQLKAMDEFQKKIKEVDEFFKKFGIDKIVLGIKDAFVGLWNWAQEHPFMATALGAGLLLLKTGILPGILSLLTSPTGLIASLGILTGLSLANLINSWNDLQKKIDETKQTAQTTIDLIEGVSRGRKNKNKELLEGIQNGQYTDDELSKKFNFISSMIKSSSENLTKNIENFKKDSERLEVLEKTPEVIRAYGLAIKDDYESIEEYIDIQEELRKKISLNDEETQKYKDSLVNLKEEIKQSGIESEKQKEILEKIDGVLNDLDNKNVTAKINIDTKQAKIDIKELINEVNQKVSGFVGLLPGIKLPSYDVGTSYVPRDQIALVHEGERIIPKQYNNADYLGQLGNSETNMLLMELNRSILEFANRPQTLNVNGKELAKVTYGDYQEEGSRRGANTSIRRV